MKLAIKKRDCTVAVPLSEALELPSTLNKQHRSPRRYARTHTHLQSVYGDRYTYPEDIKMLQCLGVLEFSRFQIAKHKARNDAFIMSCNCPPLKT